MSNVNMREVTPAVVVIKQRIDCTVLLEWKIKAYSDILWPIDLGFGFTVSIPLCILIWGLFFGGNPNTADALVMAGSFNLVVFIFLWRVAGRQKTLYHYRVTKLQGEVAYHLYYPKFASYLAKGVAVSVLVMIVTMVAISPSGILMVAGIGGMTLVAVGVLMKWEPPPTESRKTEWARYNLVFIDRKRKMVVTSYQDDQLAGFETHLKKEKIDEFVNFLKTVIPHAEFREAKWEW